MLHARRVQTEDCGVIENLVGTLRLEHDAVTCEVHCALACVMLVVTCVCKVTKTSLSLSVRLR